MQKTKFILVNNASLRYYRLVVRVYNTLISHRFKEVKEYVLWRLAEALKTTSMTEISFQMSNLLLRHDGVPVNRAIYLFTFFL
jgi:hypothetical protein